MAMKLGVLYDFLWVEWGLMKYVVFLLFVVMVVFGKDDGDLFCWYLLVIAALRYASA